MIFSSDKKGISDGESSTAWHYGSQLKCSNFDTPGQVISLGVPQDGSFSWTQWVGWQKNNNMADLMMHFISFYDILVHVGGFFVNP